MDSQQTTQQYRDQFSTAPDLLYIAIPRDEILEQMAEHGDDATVDRVCMAVAVVIDAIENARLGA